MAALYVIAALIIFLALVWLSAVLLVNDFAVPATRLPRTKRALVIFPHPDDETNVAGTIWLLRKQGVAVTVAILTKGECGTNDAHLEPTLKATRSHEMHTACHYLGNPTLIHEDFGDGQLTAKQHVVSDYLTKLVDGEQPDLVITYDLAGLYGHPDHIAVAQIVDKIVQARPDIAVWYSAWPRRLLAAAQLPTQMATDPQFATKRAAANMRVFLGFGVIAKLRDIYAHRSQRLAFHKSVPLGLPIWLVYSLQIFEYYERVR